MEVFPSGKGSRRVSLSSARWSDYKRLARRTGGGVEIGGRQARVPVSKIPCNIVTESEACPLFRWFARWWREAARGGGEASANVSDKNLSLVAAV